ncbi:MAG: nucleotidyltransferase family protein [Polaribacter sp.]|jgi:molybdenum cofactor cytidylyltransferase|nr:nucleotidyltransferase family protein [Polaribacter sp.]MDG1953924.1 nucleotidyltransferase family protein [Polaribacter sp.]MDG2074358.1 nucleotidyltransferase family protein [Polaribacter sp.]
MANIQLLLLAAGASSRMGEPKQLLSWNNKSLIEHQINNLLKTGKTTSVILGANAEKISIVIDSLPVSFFINPTWKNGMGNSISFGVQQLLEKDATIDGVLISLIDQPLLTTEHFNKILEHYQTDKKQIIVSQSEKGWLGAPVLFDKIYFNELLNLKDDEGAKVVISKNKNVVELISANTILQDIDTPEAYQKLLEKSNQ